MTSLAASTYEADVSGGKANSIKTLYILHILLTFILKYVIIIILDTLNAASSCIGSACSPLQNKIKDKTR